MSGPEVLMVDGALKRQGDSLAPQGVVCRVRQVSDNAASAGYQLVPFGAKEFDPFGWFDAAGGTYRFQPKIAGYYRITSCIVVNGVGGGTETDVYLRKNGVGVSATGTFAGDVTPALSSGWSAPKATGTVYLNGTTDYVDVLLWVAGAGLMRGTSAQYPYFEAELVGISVGVIPEPFHVIGAAGEIPYLNGWTYQAGYPVRFFKDPHGIVHLSGALNGNAATGQYAFQLPAGYRPSTVLGFPIQYWVPSAYYLGDFLINADGNVRALNNADAFVTNISYAHLNHITFRAEQ